MIVCFVGLLCIHETPDWLLENRQYEKAIKSLEFYKVDPKILVDDDVKRKSKDGQVKGYRELVGFYRKESAKHTKSVRFREDASHNTARYASNIVRKIQRSQYV